MDICGQFVVPSNMFFFCFFLCCILHYYLFVLLLLLLLSLILVMNLVFVFYELEFSFWDSDWSADTAESNCTLFQIGWPIESWLCSCLTVTQFYVDIDDFLVLFFNIQQNKNGCDFTFWFSCIHFILILSDVRLIKFILITFIPLYYFFVNWNMYEKVNKSVISNISM